MTDLRRVRGGVRSPVLGWIAAGMLALLPASTVRGDGMSVQEFIGLKPEWERFAEVALPLTVEGRYSLISRNGLRFRNCDLTFRAAPGKELVKPSGTSGTVEATGRLSDENGKLVFLVDRVREVASDFDQLRIRRARLPADKAEAWYELGEWAKGRAAFYEDTLLAEKGTELFRKGLMIERNGLPDGDVDGRLALAGKAGELGLSESLQQELVHEAFHLLWERRGTPEGPAGSDLGERMLRELPGTRVPLDPWPSKLRDAYLKDPLATYREADVPRRRALHRILYVELVREMIEADAKPDGSDGMEVAANIERRIPELRELAESYRDRALAFELAHVGTLTRDEMLALRKKFEAREQPAQATETTAQWLKIRRARLRDDDLAGLIHLAGEYVTLLKDRETSRELLLEAYRRNPKSEDAAAALRRLGYRQQGDEWISAEEFEARPADPIAQAIRQGRVAAGMSPAQVRKTLGAPTAVTRVATRHVVNEVWTYEQPGASRLAVHFLRRLGREADGHVVAVSPVR